MVQESGLAHVAVSKAERRAGVALLATDVSCTAISTLTLKKGLRVTTEVRLKTHAPQGATDRLHI